MRPWWSSFGQVVGTADELTVATAREFAAALTSGAMPGAKLIEFRIGAELAYDAVGLEVDVERPQDLAYPIRATEPIAVLFPHIDGQPRIFALREEFPDPPHQNFTPEGAPPSLCIDDRPWSEAKLTSTPSDLLRRIQLWLSKAARGELHDRAQPLDPLFYRSEFSLVIPASVFADSAADLPELVAFGRRDNPNIIIAEHVPSAGSPREARFVLLSVKVAPQGMARLRHAPTTLQGLHAEMERCGFDLIKELKARLLTWAGLQENSLRRLAARLIVVVAFPVQEGTNRSINDFRAFVTVDTAGDVGVALGTLLKHQTQIGAREAYAQAIGVASHADHVRIEPAEVHFAFSRNLAAAVAGRPDADRRRAVLIGAGALGSQIAINLAREGAFSWSVVDPDHLMPHNLARHALLAGDTGAPKDLALARQLSALLAEPVVSMHCDVLNPAGHAQKLSEAFAAADIIIDASASVAVSRHLADLPDTGARRVCAFFNPSGTAVVLMAESKDRSITLRDLEAQYHDLLLSDPSLVGHLRSEQSGLRYSGSCRALTNRIPSSSAAMLSALVARGISACVQDEQSAIRIWTLADNGEVRLAQRQGAAVTRAQLGSWTVTYNESLLTSLKGLRAQRLPNETGGILLGITDVSRRSIHVAHAMPQPQDSHGTVTGFVRGVEGLAGIVGEIASNSLHQLRYAGEWHSHPRGSSVRPSYIDLQQLAWLGDELAAEGLPALMAIAGDDGAFSFMLAESSHFSDDVRTTKRAGGLK